MLGVMEVICVASFADLSACRNFDDIVDTLKKYIVKNKISSRGIVMATGYDHNFLTGNNHPVVEVLDQASVKIPIVALHTSGRLACVNNRALQLMKITEETQDPDGGRFGRIAGTKQDGATNKLFLLLLKLADKWNKLQVDVVAYLVLDDKAKALLDKNEKYKNQYHKHLKIGGYKLILDGSP